MCLPCEVKDQEIRLSAVESAVKTLAVALMILCVGILYDKGVFRA